MQRLIIDIEESKSDILINLLQNLKDGVVKSFYIEDKIMDDDSNDDSKKDPYFYERKKELSHLRNDIKSGKEPMYNFNNSMDALIAELES